MLFDVKAALAEILASPGCDSCEPRDFGPRESQESQESQQVAAEIGPRVGEVLPFPAAPSAPAQSRQIADALPHGICALTGEPRTWTGRIVSLGAWRKLSDWERHGPAGRLHCGICKAWVQPGGACPRPGCWKGGGTG